MAIPEKKETDYLFEKTYTCPVCNTEFKALKVKASMPKLLRTDPDMPHCQKILINYRMHRLR